MDMDTVEDLLINGFIETINRLIVVCDMFNSQNYYAKVKQLGIKGISDTIKLPKSKKPVQTKSIPKKLLGLMKKLDVALMSLELDSEIIKQWILIPKREEHYNIYYCFIQDLLGELRHIKGEAALMLQRIARFFMGRANLVLSHYKHPAVDYYKTVIAEFDAEEYTRMDMRIENVKNGCYQLQVIIHNHLCELLTYDEPTVCSDTESGPITPNSVLAVRSVSTISTVSCSLSDVDMNTNSDSDSL